MNAYEVLYGGYQWKVGERKDSEGQRGWKYTAYIHMKAA
jgi:hypothetical protein